ncbi:MAG: glycosyltransferase family 8 protein [Ruminococcaceae bacterium]|nr:glycosyltransferase family 8 protein [Oscillospiraceae bacterium]
MKNMVINILVTLNEAYIPYLNTMLMSLVSSNKEIVPMVYLLHSSINDSDLELTREILSMNCGELFPIYAEDCISNDVPTTERFPKEMYYRIFAAKYLPENVDRVLYLDPDIIVNGSILKLYNTDMKGYYYAAASHNGAVTRAINGKRLKLKKGTPYINSGVLLINLTELRRNQNCTEVFDYITGNRKKLILPDQDIISALYGERIIELDPHVYNMTERQFRYTRLLGKKMDVDWIRKNSVIIHYCGKNKPWRDKYRGQLNVFYNETVKKLRGLSNYVTIE